MAHTVAVLYGFAEGSWHGRKLRKQLRQAGYQLTKDARNADIIIAHSGACYLVPKGAKAHTVMHVGYTYWPGRSLIQSLSSALLYDRKTHHFIDWLSRCVIHDLYMLQVIHTIRMIPGWHSPTRKLDTLTNAEHIFVRGRYDPYCNPKALIKATAGDHRYISIPNAGHDDLWDNPRRYINLLQS